MGLAFTLFSLIVYVSPVAPNAFKPNFATLVPQQPKVALDHTPREGGVGANVAEATGLAKYLDKAWSQLVDGTASEQLASDSLLVVRQLDDSLNGLDQAPTLTEALARVRAYYAILNVVSQNIERAKSKGWHPPATQEQIKKLRTLFYQRYRSVFARAA